MSTYSCAADKEGKPVGTILKEAREARGLSLDDAARVTRIGKGYLQALEEGMFHRLPSAVYVKGFLRVYATYLKLPENEILYSYEKNTADSHAGPDNPESQTGSTHCKIKHPLPAIKRSYVILSFLAIAAVVSYFVVTASFMKEGGKGQTTPIPAGVKAVGAGSSPGRIAGTAADIQQKESAKENKEKSDEDALGTVPPLPKGMVLKIKVTEDGWLDMTIDDAVTQHYELKSGDLIEWKGEKGFTLDIGNAGGIEAELNGKTLKPFGKSGESTHVMLKAGDNGR